MYSNDLSAPLAAVGLLAMTGPDSVVTWVIVGAAAMGAGALLTLRRRVLRRAIALGRDHRKPCR